MITSRWEDDDASTTPGEPAPADTSPAESSTDSDEWHLAAHERTLGDLPVAEETRRTDGGLMGAEAAMTGHSLGVARPVEEPGAERAEQMPPYEQSSSSDA